MLLRVQLPDVPGSLGAVATALGSIGADILAIEIVEKNADHVIDDFHVNLPPGHLADSVITTIAEVPGCRVLYLSRHQESWGIESDIQTLNNMAADPEGAASILVEAAPTVFHSQWSALVDVPGQRVIVSSELAPEFDAAGLGVLAPLDAAHAMTLPGGWIDSWPASTVAVAPLKGARAIVVGRQGGPEFLQSELNRLAHMAALAP